MAENEGRRYTLPGGAYSSFESSEMATRLEWEATPIISLMSYYLKEIYYTLQGEGAQSGRAAVFCRFSGCNLWNGREDDRASAVCTFCDTNFVGVDGVGGGVFANSEALADAVVAVWPTSKVNGKRLVICSGGEPLLQLDDAAVAALHRAGFEVAVETNGTRPVPQGVDWVCVSPKAGAPLVVNRGDELKLVYPQEGVDPAMYAHLGFTHFFLQPMDGRHRDEAIRRAVQYCLEHPQWRLSLQVQKLVGIP
jgi:7-carboxy-7-deazaguanine synthase (Cx14CxxC type)